MIGKRLLLFFAIVGVSVFSIFGCRSISIIKIPVVFREYCPTVKLVIDQKEYIFGIDSGAVPELSLNKKALDQIQNKKQKNNIKTYDFKGICYERPIYNVPSVQFAEFQVSNVNIAEEDPKFRENTTIWQGTKPLEPRYEGRIGWPFFSGYCTLFDFLNSRVILGENLSELQSKGFIDRCDSFYFSRQHSSDISTNRYRNIEA